VRRRAAPGRQVCDTLFLGLGTEAELELMSFGFRGHADLVPVPQNKTAEANKGVEKMPKETFQVKQSS
jgi:hypothetical protein